VLFSEFVFGFYVASKRSASLNTACREGRCFKPEDLTKGGVFTQDYMIKHNLTQPTKKTP
jgi:hypothetical protein